MQSLDVISINLWQIIISLCNLVILFMILKKLLYQPVRNALKKRQDALDAQAAAAEQARMAAEEDREHYAGKLKNVQIEADAMMRAAVTDAEKAGKEIVNEARTRADGIVRRAKSEAELEKKKAEAEVRAQIVDLSTALSGKLIGRELKTADHHQLIDAFLDEMGETNGTDQ